MVTDDNLNDAILELCTHFLCKMEDLVTSLLDDITDVCDKNDKDA